MDFLYKIVGGFNFFVNCLIRPINFQRDLIYKIEGDFKFGLEFFRISLKGISIMIKMVGGRLQL